jgi:hypothetical protein
MIIASRRVAAVATDAACRALGRRTVIRAARLVNQWSPRYRMCAARIHQSEESP